MDRHEFQHAGRQCFVERKGKRVALAVPWVESVFREGAAAQLTEGGQCHGVNRGGDRCQRFASGEFCLHHDPDRAAERERWRMSVAASHRSLNRARALQHLKKALAALSEEKGADSALYAIRTAIALLERNAAGG